MVDFAETSSTPDVELLAGPSREGQGIWQMSHVEIGIWGHRLGIDDTQTAFEHSQVIFQVWIDAVRCWAKVLEQERFLIEVEQQALDQRCKGVEAKMAEMILATKDNEGQLHGKEQEWEERGKK